MVSIERIVEYGGLTAEERPAEHYAQHAPVPADWPTHGHIVMRNVCLSYDENDAYNVHKMVLKDITVDIGAGQKVRRVLFADL
jgi:ABC-type multidrug transport system fused ATPase/permease subunit